MIRKLITAYHMHRYCVHFAAAFRIGESLSWQWDVNSPEGKEWQERMDKAEYHKKKATGHGV